MSATRILETLDDLVVRDVVHRHIDSRTSSNTIEHIYSHISSNTANITAATISTIDAWNLLLNTTNTANASISVTSASTVLRNAHVRVMGNLGAHECTSNVGKFGSVSLDTSTGSGIDSAVLSGSTALVTSGSVFDALAEAMPQDYPMITSLGELTSLEVKGNVVVDGGTLSVSGYEKVLVQSLPSVSNNNMDYTWISRVSSSNSNWGSVSYGNGRFVAVAFGGTGRLMSSVDGVNWVSGTIPSGGGSSIWNSVTFGTPNGNPLFVAVASTGTNRVMTSPDGLTWTLRACALREWGDVTYGNGFFVAVAFGGAGTKVMRSSNGSSWTDHDAASPLGENDWSAIAFGEGVFVAVSSAIGTWDRAMRSTDNGITWELQPSSAFDSQFGSIAYGNGRFVAVAYSANDFFIMTSTDGGVTWSGSDPPEDSQWVGVSFGGGFFVAVASGLEEGVGERAMISSDGDTWTLMPTPDSDNQWFDSVYGDGVFVAVASSGTGNRVMTWDLIIQEEDGGSGLKLSGQATFGHAILQQPLIVPTSAHVGNVVGTHVDLIGGLAFKSNTVVVDASVSSSSTDLTLNANAYRHTGSSFNAQNGASRGKARMQSYPLYAALPAGGDESRREYGVSQRFWSGKVVKTNGSYTLSCHGNGSYPLYGDYTVTYATKAGTYDYERAMCMRGSTSSQGQTNTLTWRALSEVSSNTAGLSVTFGSGTWLPTIFFTNTTGFHAWFSVCANVFDDATVFNEPGV